MERRKFTQFALLTCAGAAIPGLAQATERTNSDFFNVLKNRRSVRAYTDAPVSEDDIKIMLECAMLAPSARNEQPWEFIVITDRAVLSEIARINQYASFATKAPLAILLCLNDQKVKEPGMAIIDMGTCAENLMLAATALNLGSVFTGIFPIKERMDGFCNLCNLPAHVKPIGLIVIGHPAIDHHAEVNRYNPEAIHKNKW